MLEDELLTIQDLARYLRLKPQTIYRWAQSRKIPGAKFGKEWRFRRSEIQSWIEANYTEAKSRGVVPARPRRNSRGKRRKPGGPDGN